jgi:hypothetical protein
MRLALAGAATLTILFILCWGAAVFWIASPSHMFVALFTLTPVETWYSLCEGVLSALVFGALTGALLAWIYNALAPFERDA